MTVVRTVLSQPSDSWKGRLGLYGPDLCFLFLKGDQDSTKLPMNFMGRSVLITRWFLINENQGCSTKP